MIDNAAVPVDTNDAPDVRANSHAAKYASAGEAFRALHEVMLGTRELIASLEIEKGLLQRELLIQKANETKLNERLQQLNSIASDLEDKKFALTDATRLASANAESSEKYRAELQIKTEALLTTREELTAALSNLQRREAELEELQTSFAETDRKREHFEQIAQAKDALLQDKLRAFIDADERLTAASAALSEHQAKLKDTEASLERTTAEYKQQAQELKDARWGLHQERELLRFTQAELARKNELLLDLEKQTREREDKIHELDDRCHRYSEDNQALNNRVSECESLIARLEKAIGEKQESLTNLHELNGELRGQVDRLTESLATSEDLIRQKVGDREAMERELAQIRQQFREQTRTLTTFQVEHVGILQTLNVEQQKRREFESRSERQQTEINALQVELAQVYERLADTRDELASATFKLTDATQELSEVKSNLQEHTRGKSHINATVERLQKEVDSKARAFREAQAEASRYKEKFDLLTLKYSHLQVTLNDAQAKVVKYKETTGRSAGRRPTLRDSVEAMRASESPKLTATPKGTRTETQTTK
ncbi:MAG: hypothetical protein U0136_21945 [Bdellovibrionota bacterium]